MARPLAAGVLCALGAFLAWGASPVYFKALVHVPPAEILAHRIVWSALVLGVALVGLRGLGAVREALRDRRTRLALAATSVLIAFNWLVFVWAVVSGNLLQSSLGYFINPLVNVALGMVFLRERLRPWQLVALLLATTSVATLVVRHGRVPWVALSLAVTFGFYGLLRKTARIDAMGGLFVETCLLLPLALAYGGWLLARGELAFVAQGMTVTVLLLLAGVVTTIPLLLFTAAARRLRLVTVGFFQYISPTSQLLLAVLAYGEPFTREHLVSFSILWLGIAIYTADSVRALRRPVAT
jgi:chloramphenicol-sensitive protein RarD